MEGPILHGASPHHGQPESPASCCPAPPVIPSLNYQHKPALCWGRRGFHSFAIVFALHVWNNSAPPAKQLLFHSPCAEFFQSPKPSPRGEDVAWSPAQHYICTNRTRGTCPCVGRFEGAQPLTKITSLPCVLPFWKTQPRPFPDSKEEIAGLGLLLWLRGVYFLSGCVFQDGIS